MERRGKSSPFSAVTQKACKPYPEQHRTEEKSVGPTLFAKVAFFKLHGRPAAKIDCRHYRTRLIFRSQQKRFSQRENRFCCDMIHNERNPWWVSFKLFSFPKVARLLHSVRIVVRKRKRFLCGRTVFAVTWFRIKETANAKHCAYYFTIRQKRRRFYSLFKNSPFSLHISLVLYSYTSFSYFPSLFLFLF